MEALLGERVDSLSGGRVDDRGNDLHGDIACRDATPIATNISEGDIGDREGLLDFLI